MQPINPRSAKPLYRQLKEFILTQVANGTFKPGEKLPSHAQFQKRFKLSVGTVRRVLYELSREGVLYSRHGKGVFISKTEPVGPGKERKSIGLLYSFGQTSGPYLSRLLDVVASQCRSSGYELKIYSGYGLDDVLREAVVHNLVNGFLLASSFPPELVGFLRENGRPFVWLNNQGSARDANCVVSDPVQAVGRGIEYLAGLRHRRIGLLSGPETSWSFPLVVKGLADSLAKAGLEANPDWICPGTWGEDSGYRLMKQMLLKKEIPSAILAGDDLMGLGAIKAAWEAGLKIPRDLSIIGFGNILSVHLQMIPLTVLDMHLEEIGRASVQMLADIMENYHLPKRVWVSSELIVRQTTAAPASSSGLKKRNGIRRVQAGEKGV